MKKLFFSMGAMAALMAVSCSSHDEPGFPETPEVPEAPETYQPDFGRAISAEDATSAALNALANFYDGIGSRADEPTVEIVSKGDKDTALYVVSLAQGGYAIVDPDENAPVRVLGMSDNGTCPEIAKSYCQRLKSSYITDATPGITIPKPDQPLPLKPAIDTVMTAWSTPSWGEGAPYNKYCKTEDGEQSNASTMAVAMASVMAYYKYPTSIGNLTLNWSTIWPNASSGADDTIARLMAQIGVDTEIFYEPDKANFDIDDIVPTLKKYGYRGMNKTTDIDDLFDQYGPSIGYATSSDKKLRCWVVDGKMTTKWVNKGITDVDGNKYPDEVIETKYLRFNWCIDGSGNGWYVADAKWQFKDNGRVITIQTTNNVPGYIVNIYKP